jgi:nitrate/nitrite transporter NarK
MLRGAPHAAWLNLAYATLSLTLGFAAWGLISAFAPAVAGELQLSPQATALLIAVPVILGSLFPGRRRA